MTSTGRFAIYHGALALIYLPFMAAFLLESSSSEAALVLCSVLSLAAAHHALLLKPFYLSRLFEQLKVPKGPSRLISASAAAIGVGYILAVVAPKDVYIVVMIATMIVVSVLYLLGLFNIVLRSN